MDLIRAADALQSGDIARAEALCRDCLRREPGNAAAIKTLADIGMHFGRLDEAEELLRYCLEIAPGFHQARPALAELLCRQLRCPEALEEIDKALAAAPSQPSYLLLKGVILAQSARNVEALELFDAVLERHPGEARIHLNRGRALQTAGRHADAVAAFRAALRLEPGLAEAWWSLCDLKTFRFDDEDVVEMRAQLGADTTSEEDRIFLNFALAKALEDAAEYDESFRHYADGNVARRRSVCWDEQEHHADVARVAALFDASFFASRLGWGNPSAAPIFIVGLPRAGSTLLEQILASHSRVEGTMELPDVMAIARRLGGNAAGAGRTAFPGVLRSLSAGDFAALGEEYLQRTARHRTGAPFFVDKMPNNFIHVGLIHLMLPGAKILDARRQPMACGFSVFKQLFVHGQTFSYDLWEIGRYYREYVRLMKHWDDVLPSRVLRVNYETVVGDTDNQVRRILDHCGLEFEPGCVEFHRTERVVRSASSEQVRQPIYWSAVEQWRHYERHLGPLRKGLGTGP
jgi:tetratricopeptide (TPR) repeat protein